MTTNSAVTFPDSPRVVPTGVANALRRAGRRLLRSFRESGASRARNEMLALAQRFESAQPELAAELRAASVHPVSY